VTAERYRFVADLAAEAPVPERGIHSQTLSSDDGIELVLFAMAAGEQQSEHTSARPAIIQCLAGSGDLVVDGDRHTLGPASWLRMAAHTSHAVEARTGLVFALYLLPAGA